MKISEADEIGKYFHIFTTLKDYRPVGVHMGKVESMYPDVDGEKEGMQLVLNSGQKVFVQYDPKFGYFGWDTKDFSEYISIVRETLK